MAPPRTSVIFLLACLVIFHSPDGSLVSVEKQHVAVVRPVTEPIKEHVAAGTRALLYVGSHKIGITETAEEAEAMLEQCEQ